MKRRVVVVYTLATLWLLVVYPMATSSVLLATCSLLVVYLVARGSLHVVSVYREVHYDKTTGSRRVGYIYYFRGKRENPLYVKVGRAVDPYSRLVSHRTANPHGIALLGVMKVHNDVLAEKLIHTRYYKSRLYSSNEWFRLTPSLLLYILLSRDTRLTKKLQDKLDVSYKTSQNRRRTTGSKKDSTKVY